MEKSLLETEISNLILDQPLSSEQQQESDSLQRSQNPSRLSSQMSKASGQELTSAQAKS